MQFTTVSETNEKEPKVRQPGKAKETDEHMRHLKGKVNTQAGSLEHT